MGLRLFSNPEFFIIMVLTQLSSTQAFRVKSIIWRLRAARILNTLGSPVSLNKKVATTRAMHL